MDVVGDTLAETACPGQELFACVILRQEVLDRNTELTSHHQPEEFWKGQKEMPRVLGPPRICLASLRLG